MDLNELTNKLTNIKLTSETLDQSIQTLEQYQKKRDASISFEGTYLENKESIIELYKLFWFYFLVDSYFYYLNPKTYT